MPFFRGRELVDSYRAQGLRRRLAEELRAKKLFDEKIIQAIEKIPRHFLLDSSFLEFAYQDKAFPIGEGQTISQPFTVATQTQLLTLEKNMKVLEIGTGSGYQAMVLLELGAKVFSIERVKELYLRTRELLQIMGYKPSLFWGDGYKGLPTYAPFDRIIITAAVSEPPKALLDQLKPGGIMVIPEGEHTEDQLMKTYTKKGENNFEIVEHGRFRFVPMLEGK